MPFCGRRVMTKELSVQRELNYAFCHTVTVNLMCTESKINILSKAADALLSTLPRWNYMVLLNTGGTGDHPKIAIVPYIRINPCKFLWIYPFNLLPGCAEESRNSARLWPYAQIIRLFIHSFFFKSFSYTALVKLHFTMTQQNVQWFKHERVKKQFHWKGKKKKIPSRLWVEKGGKSSREVDSNFKQKALKSIFTYSSEE